MTAISLPTSRYQFAFAWGLFVVKVVGTLSAGALVLLYIFQNNILYIPRPPGFPATPDDNPQGYRSPREWTVNGKLSTQDFGSDTVDYEDHMLTTSDNNQIHTWLLLQPISQDVPTLIYFHGNAGNMGFRLQNSAEIFARVRINIVMMDYRGYGKRLYITHTTC